MAFSIVGGVAGFVLGSALGALLFDPETAGARPIRRPARNAGRQGAAILLLTIAVFGGMASGAIAGA